MKSSHSGAGICRKMPHAKTQRRKVVVKKKPDAMRPALFFTNLWSSLFRLYQPSYRYPPFGRSHYCRHLQNHKYHMDMRR